MLSFFSSPLKVALLVAFAISMGCSKKNSKSSEAGDNGQNNPSLLDLQIADVSGADHLVKVTDLPQGQYRLAHIQTLVKQGDYKSAFSQTLSLPGLFRNGDPVQQAYYSAQTDAKDFRVNAELAVPVSIESKMAEWSSGVRFDQIRYYWNQVRPSNKWAWELNSSGTKGGLEIAEVFASDPQAYLYRKDNSQAYLQLNGDSLTLNFISKESDKEVYAKLTYKKESMLVLFEGGDDETQLSLDQNGQLAATAKSAEGVGNSDRTAADRQAMFSCLRYSENAPTYESLQALQKSARQDLAEFQRKGSVAALAKQGLNLQVSIGTKADAPVYTFAQAEQALLKFENDYSTERVTGTGYGWNEDVFSQTMQSIQSQDELVKWQEKAIAAVKSAQTDAQVFSDKYGPFDFSTPSCVQRLGFTTEEAGQLTFLQGIPSTLKDFASTFTVENTKSEAVLWKYQASSVHYLYLKRMEELKPLGVDSRQTDQDSDKSQAQDSADSSSLKPQGHSAPYHHKAVKAAEKSSGKMTFVPDSNSIDNK